MRFTVITNTVVAGTLLTLSPGSAIAGTDDVPNRVDAINHANTMRSLARLHEQLAEQTERNAAPVKVAPPSTVRIVRDETGFSWVDGAVGGGLTAAVLLAAAGAQTARRSAGRPSPAPHSLAPTSQSSRPGR